MATVDGNTARDNATARRQEGQRAPQRGIIYAHGQKDAKDAHADADAPHAHADAHADAPQKEG